MSPVCLWDDASYVIHGHVASSSEYGSDKYDDALGNFLSNKTSCEETIFLVLGT